MDWVVTFAGSLVVLLLLIPLATVVSVMVFLWGAGHALASTASLARATFDCPFSKRRVTAEFATTPGSEHPSEVLSCSIFQTPEGIRCQKRCLAVAAAGWAPSPMMPRFALISGGVAMRPLRLAAGPAPDGAPPAGVTRAA